MRLIQTLAKAMVILAVIALTLGGAVALGSTLFDAPPRNAAEFAARVEAGSTHAPPPQKRTADERRYVLGLNELCAERNELVRKLESPALPDDQIARLRGWRTIFARFSDDFTALTPPRRYRAGAARASELGRAELELVAGALDARRSGDRETFEAKTRAAELLDGRYDQVVLGLGAPACVTR